MKTPQSPRLAQLALFDFLFWTPLWLVPLLAEVRPAAAVIGEDIVTGIATSALLAALAHLAGRYRRYAYLVLGLVVWTGAAAFVAYAVLGAGQINAYGLFDASQYASSGARLFGYVTGYGAVFGWLTILSLPFVALVFFWRRLASPIMPVYAAALLAVFILPLPAKFVRCSLVACDKTWDLWANLYPIMHYRAFDSYVALNDFHAFVVERAGAVTRPAPPVHNLSKSPLTLVVVVGETFNRNHMSLYSYCRPTTPNLDALRDRLFVFQDTIALMPLTAWAVPTSLHIARWTAGKTNTELLPILNAGGFDTTWISNQPNITNPPNSVAQIAMAARNRVWLNALESLTVIDPADGDLLAPLTRALSLPASRKAIFLHMNGAHIKYLDRVPAGYPMPALPVFSGSRTAAQRDSINEYDRAIRYDDDIFGAIIAQVTKQGGDSAVVIYGDHGEENFDQMPFIGHGWPNPTRNMIEAPLVVWLSPSLRQHRPDLVAALSRAASERLQIGDISAVIVDLAGLAVGGLPDALRPLSSSFEPSSRMVGDENYDSDRNIGVTPQLSALCGLPGRLH